MQSDKQDRQEKGETNEVLFERIAQTYLEELRSGAAPDLEAYCRRYPAFKKEIRELFPTLASLEGLCDAARHDPAPQVIGPYQIIREIGRGGMGVVYEARHCQDARRVALKLITPERRSDTAAVARFRREIAACMELSHPGIITVYETGEYEDGLYYAMALVEGETLDRHLHSMASTSEREKNGMLIRLFRDICDGLDHAHRCGVIHRDIKPANILVTHEGRPLLADFGLAQMDGESLTRSADIVGTLRYLAPERLNSWSDPRSDLYSLGLVILEAVTGYRISGEDDGKGLLQAISSGPSILRRRRLPGADSELELILRKLLELEPAGRYQSATALRKDLDRYLEGRPVLARRPGTIRRLRAWANRNRLATGLLTGLTVLTAATGYVAKELHGTSRQLRTTAGDLREKQQQAEEARQTADFLRIQAEGSATAALQAERRASRLLLESQLSALRTMTQFPVAGHQKHTLNLIRRIQENPHTATPDLVELRSAAAAAAVTPDLSALPCKLPNDADDYGTLFGLIYAAKRTGGKIHIRFYPVTDQPADRDPASAMLHQSEVETVLKSPPASVRRILALSRSAALCLTSDRNLFLCTPQNAELLSRDVITCQPIVEKESGQEITKWCCITSGAQPQIAIYNGLQSAPVFVRKIMPPAGLHHARISANGSRLALVGKEGSETVLRMEDRLSGKLVAERRYNKTVRGLQLSLSGKHAVIHYGEDPGTYVETLLKDSSLNPTPILIARSSQSAAWIRPEDTRNDSREWIMVTQTGGGAIVADPVSGETLLNLPGISRLQQLSPAVVTAQMGSRSVRLSLSAPCLQSTRLLSRTLSSDEYIVAGCPLGQQATLVLTNRHRGIIITRDQQTVSFASLPGNTRYARWNSQRRSLLTGSSDAILEWPVQDSSSTLTVGPARPAWIRRSDSESLTDVLGIGSNDQIQLSTERRLITGTISSNQILNASPLPGPARTELLTEWAALSPQPIINDQLWLTKQQQQLLKSAGLSRERVASLIANPQANWVGVGYQDGSFYCFERTEKRPSLLRPSGSQRIVMGAVSDDGLVLTAASASGELLLFRPQTGSLFLRLPGTTAGTTPVSVSLLGAHHLSVTWPDCCRFFDLGGLVKTIDELEAGSDRFTLDTTEEAQNISVNLLPGAASGVQQFLEAQELASDDVNQALQHCRSAEALGFEYGLNSELQSRLALQAGRIEEAEAAIRLWRTREENSLNALDRLIQIRVKQQDWTDALRMADQLREVDDSDFPTRHHARCLYELHKYEESLRQAERFLQRTYDHEQAALRCRNLAALGRDQDAVIAWKTLRTQEIPLQVEGLLLSRCVTPQAESDDNESTKNPSGETERWARRLHQVPLRRNEELFLNCAAIGISFASDAVVLRQAAAEETAAGSPKTPSAILAMFGVAVSSGQDELAAQLAPRCRMATAADAALSAEFAAYQQLLHAAPSTDIQEQAARVQNRVAADATVVHSGHEWPHRLRMQCLRRRLRALQAPLETSPQ